MLDIKHLLRKDFYLIFSTESSKSKLCFEGSVGRATSCLIQMMDGYVYMELRNRVLVFIGKLEIPMKY